MLIYTPNSIILPLDLEIEREIPYSFQLTNSDKTKQDTKTIFYDVFIDKRTRQLRCIGPRLYNLRKELFPLTIRVGNRVVSYRYYEIEHIFFLETTNLVTNLPKIIEIEFSFKCYKKTVALNWQRDEHRISAYDNIPLTISTLQRDNHIEWIGDWLLWHRRLYDIRRVVLYDNSSSNREQLINFLRVLKSELQIIFVDWPFPHGVKPVKHAQRGSLNHCRLRFPVSRGYCVNLDVDEYLVKSECENLLDFLDRTLKYPSPGAVLFHSTIVPNVLGSDQRGIPRFFNFLYRHRNAKYSWIEKKWERISPMKYIYQFDNIGYNGTHRTNSEKNRSFGKRYSIFCKTRHLVKKCHWKLSQQCSRHPSEKPKIDSCHASDSELFYFHFLGLTTGWQKFSHKLPERFNCDKHVQEPLIAKLAKLAKLRDIDHSRVVSKSRLGG